MSKRTWVMFGAVQIIGCVLAGYGTVYSESAFVRGSWLCGFLLLLPGNLPAMALNQKLVHVRPTYVFFPVAIACNAILWVTCSAAWGMLRRHNRSAFDRYGIALAATGTTWAEQPDPTRSDSHAWSSHPNYDLLTMMAGIRPRTPGFGTVTIAPHLGSLKHVSATMPSPKGDIDAEYTVEFWRPRSDQFARPSFGRAAIAWQTGEAA